jgi:hypothetical protein
MRSFLTLPRLELRFLDLQPLASRYTDCPTVEYERTLPKVFFSYCETQTVRNSEFQNYAPTCGHFVRATGSGLCRRRVGAPVPVGSRFFPSPPRLDRFWGLPSLLSPGVKRLGRKSHQSPPSSSDINNGGVISSFPHTPSWRST